MLLVWKWRTEESLSAPSSIENKVVYLTSETLTLLHICVGNFVWIESEEPSSSPHICQVKRLQGKNKKKKLTSFAYGGDLFEENMTVRLRPIPVHYLPSIQTLRLRPQQDMMSTTTSPQTVGKMLLSKAVSQSEVLTLNHVQWDIVALEFSSSDKYGAELSSGERKNASVGLPADEDLKNETSSVDVSQRNLSSASSENYNVVLPSADKDLVNEINSSSADVSQCNLSSASIAADSSKDEKQTVASTVADCFLYDRVRQLKWGVVSSATQVLIEPAATLKQQLSVHDANESIFLNDEDDGQYKRFGKLVASALNSKSSFASLLLCAPSGGGKSYAVEALAAQYNATVVRFDNLTASKDKDSLNDVFTRCQGSSRAIILLLENIELIFSKKMDDMGTTKVLNDFISQMEVQACSSSSSFTVIGTACCVDLLHDRIRNCFTDEVVLEVPSRRMKKKLSEHILSQFNTTSASNLDSTCSDELNVLLNRYCNVLGDVCSLFGEVIRHSTFRLLSNSENTSSSLEDVEITCKDLKAVISQRSIGVPRNSKWLSTSTPNVSWSDVGGSISAKQSLQEMVVWPREKPHIFKRMGISPPLGVLLYGPPGTGKTMLVKAAANASKSNFISVKTNALMSSELGESEKAISAIFESAKLHKPCIIFFDEFQSVFGNRENGGQMNGRMTSQLLLEMDSLRRISEVGDRFCSGVTVIGATNCLDAIDESFLQPGRFSNTIFVGPPNDIEREEILNIMRRRMPWDDDVDIKLLTEETEGFCGADLTCMCQQAGLIALEENESSKSLSMNHFTKALMEMKNHIFLKASAQ